MQTQRVALAQRHGEPRGKPTTHLAGRTRSADRTGWLPALSPASLGGATAGCCDVRGVWRPRGGAGDRQSPAPLRRAPSLCSQHQESGR